MRINIRKAKARFSELIERACQGEEIVIARGSKPLVRLVPATSPKRNRRPGRLKGKISYSQDAFDPLTDEELKDLGFD